MRAMLSLLALPLLLAAAPAHDWTATVRQTADGAFVLGNPAARVKLVEYASYTCPHCAAFATESAPVLKGRMIRDGSVSWEVRHFVRDQVDLAAAVVARCGGATRFFRLNDAILAAQGQWLPRAIDYQGTNAARLRMYPPLARLSALADGAGLKAIGRGEGLSDAAINACFADQASVDRIVAMTAHAPDIAGTPAFFVNGAAVEGVNWTTLVPVLRARGAQ